MPGDRAARADAGDEGVDVATRLLPDFRTRRLHMGLGVGGVGELVDVEAAGNALGQTLGHVGVIFRVAMRHVRTRQTNIGAHRPEMLDLFLGHLVRDDQKHLISPGPTDQRQRQAGVARRRLHDGAAFLQEAFALGGVQHGDGDSGP